LFNFIQFYIQKFGNFTLKVICNTVPREIMQNDRYQDIINLENDIVQIETNILDFLKLKHEGDIRKSIRQLESNLKYLSILANGAPINKNEDRKIMDFLRTHYDYLQKLSVPA
jgi:hypothetical protein